MRPPAAQRVFLPRHLQARLAKEIVLSVLASSVSLAISEVARRFGLISTQSFPWLVALTSLVLIAFVVFSMRRGVDRRAMWLSFDDQPILEYRRLSSVESSLDLEWDDLVCIASIRQPQKFRATDLGRFDWRVVSLRHRFVITVPNIEELPVPWRNALIALLGPPPHHSDTMLHPTADLN